MIDWKTTFGKIVLDSDQIQAPVMKCIVDSISKFIQKHLGADHHVSWQLSFI
jgi:hypothetical protein